MACFCTKNDTDACFTLLFSFLQPFPFLSPFLQILSSLLLPVLFSFRSPLLSPIPLSHLSSLSPIYLPLLSVLKKSVIFQWYLHTTRTHLWTRPENYVFKSNQETLYILKVNWTRLSDNFKIKSILLKCSKPLMFQNWIKTRGPLVLYHSPEDMLKSVVIEEKKVKHSLITKTLSLGNSVICCKFQNILFNVWLYTFFSWFYTCI